MKGRLLVSLFAIALLSLSSTAMATILGPGGVPEPTGAVAPDILPVGAFPAVTTLLASTGGTFTTLDLSGTYEAVVLSDPANVFCAGCLDFEIQIVTSVGADNVGRVTTANFAGFLTDVGYDPAFCGIFVCSVPIIAPTTVDRNTDDTIGFNFAGGVGGGAGSSILEIETNAHSYKSGIIGIIDGSPTGVLGYAPNVPEPGVAGLLGLGLFVGLPLLRRKLFA